MFVLGDPRHGGAGLALAAGAQRHDLVRRQLLEFGLLVKGKVRVEIASLLRRFDDAVHGAADHHELAARGARGIGDRTDARHVRGEDGHRHGLRRLGDQTLKGDRDIGFRRRHAVTDGIGGIADERSHDLLTKRLEASHVRRRAGQRRLVELPVAGMEHGAKVGLDDDRRWLRDRMGHVDELNVERSDGTSPTERHDVQRKVRQESASASFDLSMAAVKGVA